MRRGRKGRIKWRSQSNAIRRTKEKRRKEREDGATWGATWGGYPPIAKITGNVRGVVGWWHLKLESLKGRNVQRTSATGIFSVNNLIYTFISSSQTSSITNSVDRECTRGPNFILKKRRLVPSSHAPLAGFFTPCAVAPSSLSYVHSLYCIKPWTPLISSKCPFLPRH